MTKIVAVSIRYEVKHIAICSAAISPDLVKRTIVINSSSNNRAHNILIDYKGDIIDFASNGVVTKETQLVLEKSYYYDGMVILLTPMSLGSTTLKQNRVRLAHLEDNHKVGYWLKYTP